MLKKFCASVTLLGLLNCSGTPRATTLTKPPCVIPAWPTPPVLELRDDCPESAVCLTLESAVAMALWIREMRRIQAILETCDGVKTRPVPVP